ncbi:MAG: GNAT family N-acetyltransferase [Lachnospiraceae bacterium]|jgi:ribosomal protein S18 acetylase RimI-like enzyme|nr:GNAT family N-acetyltransferase [Lachnospiraceae bacterium]
MVRLAKREDLVRINELRWQVNNLHCMGRPDIFRSGFQDELRDFVYDIYEFDNSDVIAVVRDEVICGYACVEYIDKPLSAYTWKRSFYHISEFGVDSEFRRQGVATELFEFIKEHAKSKGLDKIELDVWEFNDIALRFYESLGFRTYRRYMEFDNQ